MCGHASSLFDATTYVLIFQVWAHSYSTCPCYQISCPVPFAASEVDETTPLPLLVGSMPWSECAEGELGPVIEYVKRSQYLKLPEEWWPYL